MTQQDPEPRLSRRIALKTGAGALATAGIGIAYYRSTRPALALETDDNIGASDVTFGDNERGVTDVTLQPSLDFTYENFSAGIDEFDLTLTVETIVANVTEGNGPTVDASTYNSDWYDGDSTDDLTVFDTGSGDNGTLVNDSNLPVGTTSTLSSVSESPDVDATGVTDGGVSGSDETAAVQSAFSMVDNLADIEVSMFPGGGQSNEIGDDEAGVSEVTISYDVTLRDTDDSVTNSDSETATYFVVIDNPSSDTDTSGTSGTGGSAS